MAEALEFPLAYRGLRWAPPPASKGGIPLSRMGFAISFSRLLIVQLNNQNHFQIEESSFFNLGFGSDKLLGIFILPYF